jgi:hypothetical protein
MPRLEPKRQITPISENPLLPRQTLGRKITRSKPIPHIALPFKKVIAEVLKVKPPERKPKERTKARAPKGQQ